MEKAKVEELRELLLKMKTEILNAGTLTKSDDLHVSSDDLPDEADLATNVINQQISFNMRQRELSKLRQIEMALQRINEGSYGECEDCGDDIGFKRLKTQPFTSLCITHAEEYEREQSRFKRIG
tara:strand:- start:37810 stop:38181 length:372 start_codon:yes stop_codon:yes gene_type:complete